MADSVAVHAHGTLLKRGDGASPEVFATIAEVMNISGPGTQADAIEVTHQESIESFREYIGGMKDGGEISFELNFLPANATQGTAGLFGRVGEKDNYQLLLPTSPAYKLTMAAIVTAYEVNADMAEQLKASITLKVSGKPVLAAA